MNNLFGLNIHVSPLIKPAPVLMLRHDVPCTDEFRALMDKWLLDLFGTRQVVYCFGGRDLAMSPETHRNLIMKMEL